MTGTRDAGRPDGDGQTARGDHGRLRDVPGRSPSQYEQALARRGRRAGVERSTRSGRRFETGTVALRRRGRRAAPCPPGPSSGRSCRGPAYQDGGPVLVAEEYWTATRTSPDWDLDARWQTFLVRVIVDGVPPLRVELTIGNDRRRSPRASSGGQLAVAMTAVRAIPYVLGRAARRRHPHRCSVRIAGRTRSVRASRSSPPRCRAHRRAGRSRPGVRPVPGGRPPRRAIAAPARGSGAGPTLRSVRRWRSGRRRC